MKETVQFGGVMTRLSPASPRWRDGMLGIAVNKRMAEDDIFRRRPGLSSYISVPCPTANAPLPILNLWHVRFDETSINKDYIIAHVGDGNGNHDGELYYWDLTTPGTTWTEITTETVGVADDEPGTGYTYNGMFYYSDSEKQYVWGPDQALATPGVAAPSVPTVDDDSTTSIDPTSRIQRGKYFLTSTIINRRRFVEGLPAPSAVADIATDNSTRITITPSSTGNVWRSGRSSSLDFVSGDLSHFYFVGNGSPVTDRRSDAEIARQPRLNCRGGRPRICRYTILNQGRAWYAGFDYASNGLTGEALGYWDPRCLEWSSAGRVEEVARKYTITFPGSESLVQLPELTPGQFGEARTFLADEVAGAITGLAGYGNQTITFTQRQAIAATGGVEPFAFRILSRDVGLCSHWTLQQCGDYGLMGADAYGPWLYDGTFKHVGRAMLDLSSTSATGVNSARLSYSFGVWVRELKEFWWFCAPPGGTLRTRAIPYQAERGLFCGPYDFCLGTAEVTCGVNVVRANVDPVTILGLSNGRIVKVDSTVMTDSDGTTARGWTARSRFYFGAEGGRGLKKSIGADLVFESITEGGQATARMWAGDSVDFGPRDTPDHYMQETTMTDYPIGHIPPAGQGRFIALDISESEGVEAPLVWITLRAQDER